MTNLPEVVDEAEAEEMFSVADRDGNGRITYKEFRRMCVVPKQEPIPDEPTEVLANAPVEKKDTIVVSTEK